LGVELLTAIAHGKGGRNYWKKIAGDSTNQFGAKTLKVAGQWYTLSRRGLALTAADVGQDFSTCAAWCLCLALEPFEKS
jgi:hypothetical protein